MLRDISPNPRNKAIKSWRLYVLLLPALICIIVFAYAPMYGVQIAFRDFRPSMGLSGSPWAGSKYFLQFFTLSNFKSLLVNTLAISTYTMVFSFPAPILLAMLLNQLRFRRLKRFVQTVTYAPYFISTVVLVSMLNIFLAPKTGFINTILVSMGTPPITFMARPEWFRTVYVASGVWQSCGWNAIIYLAALGGISPELYEAAMVDGANRLQRLLHIDLPGIMPTIVIMFILNMGNLMNVGYEKTYLMQNAMNNPVSEIISTFVYKTGLINAQYSFSAAIGLFNSAINCALVVLTNLVSSKLSETSLW